MRPGCRTSRPIGTLFASMLGYNPIQKMLSSQPDDGFLTPGQLHTLTGRSFFPHLISPAFGQGIHYAFTFAIICSIMAAITSLLRGKARPGDAAAKLAAAGVA